MERCDGQFEHNTGEDQGATRRQEYFTGVTGFLGDRGEFSESQFSADGIDKGSTEEYERG